MVKETRYQFQKDEVAVVPIQKLFAYGTLLNPSTFEKMTPNLEKLISIEPAYIEGKMYSAGNFPIVLRPNDYKRAKAPWFVYGGLITFEAPDEVWRSLDAYEGCSKASLGENRPTDLYHRDKVKVQTIKFESFSEFIEYKFDKVREDEAEVYFGNPDSSMVQNILKHKKRAGTIWKSFFNMQIK